MTAPSALPVLPKVRVAGAPLSRVGLTPWLAALVGAVLLLVRTEQRWLHPTFFAEDGEIFYVQARLKGLSVFFDPYNGYLHVIPRACEAIVAAVPLEHAAAVNVALALGLELALTAPLLSRRLAWLIPSPVLRGIVFVAVQLLGEQNETSANVANLVFIGGVALAAIALSDPPRTRAGQLLEVLAVLVLGLSGPIVIITAPLFVVRLVRSGRAGFLRDLPMFVALGVAAVVQLGEYATSSRTTSGGGTVPLFAQVTLQRVFGSWGLGETRARFYWHTHHTLMVTACVVFLLVVVLLAVRTVQLGVVVGLGAAAALGIGTATWAYGPVLVDFDGDDRHFVLPTLMILLALAAGVSRVGPATWVRILAGAVLATFLIGAAVSFHLDDYAVPTDTGALQSCLRSDAVHCSTPISPGSGWVIELR